jgi:hypothetical protein
MVFQVDVRAVSGRALVSKKKLKQCCSWELMEGKFMSNVAGFTSYIHLRNSISGVIYENGKKKKKGTRFGN